MLKDIYFFLAILNWTVFPVAAEFQSLPALIQIANGVQSGQDHAAVQTMVSKLTDMAVEWDGFSGGLECDFNILAEEVEKQLDVLDAQIRDWAKGFGDGR